MQPPQATLDHARHATEQGDDTLALHLIGQLNPAPADLDTAATLALRLGRPSLAARWWTELLAHPPVSHEDRVRLNLAAALWRLGEHTRMLETLAPLPDTARKLVLTARAHQGRGQSDPQPAERARDAARTEGDAGALTAAATLLGELHLAAGDNRAALHALAEGLKVAELTVQEADPHLLAVLAHAQHAHGSARKAHATAQKALERSLPRTPARVLALRALGHEAEAEAEVRAGEMWELE